MTDFSDLLSGYRRFRQTEYGRQRDRWDELRKARRPR